jgi:hypothetical protein
MEGGERMRRITRRKKAVDPRQTRFDLHGGRVFETPKNVFENEPGLVSIQNKKAWQSRPSGEAVIADTEEVLFVFEKASGQVDVVPQGKDEMPGKLNAALVYLSDNLEGLDKEQMMDRVRSRLRHTGFMGLVSSDSSKTNDLKRYMKTGLGMVYVNSCTDPETGNVYVVGRSPKKRKVSKRDMLKSSKARYYQQLIDRAVDEMNVLGLEIGQVKDSPLVSNIRNTSFQLLSASNLRCGFGFTGVAPSCGCSLEVSLRGIWTQPYHCPDEDCRVGEHVEIPTGKELRERGLIEEVF